MSVFDPCGFFPNQRPILHAPAVAELAVLGSGGTEVGIKTAAVKIVIAAKSHIVAREKIGIRLVSVEVTVDQIDDQLARFGKKIVFQSVEGGATDQSLGMISQGGHERFQPGRRGEAVVIGEGKKFPARLGDAAITRSGRAGVVLMDQLQCKFRRTSRGIERQGRFAAVIHHDDFEG
ncbi:MAG: hypothetical protein WCI38_04525, partial [Chthoniobacterales bacterium]